MYFVTPSGIAIFDLRPEVKYVHRSRTGRYAEENNVVLDDATLDVMLINIERALEETKGKQREMVLAYLEYLRDEIAYDVQRTRSRRIHHHSRNG